MDDVTAKTADGEERVVGPRLRSEDVQSERSLRPRRLAEYIGQAHYDCAIRIKQIRLHTAIA